MKKAETSSLMILLLVIGTISCEGLAAGNRPNIVVIMTDNGHKKTYVDQPKINRRPMEDAWHKSLPQMLLPI